VSVEANKVVMRRYFDEIWNQRRLELLDELVAPEYVSYANPGLEPGPAGLRPVFDSVLATFPDIHFSMDDMLAEGDRVVTRWTMEGTQQGEFMGRPGSGRRVRYSGISIDRVVDGKIVEHWRVSDDLGMLQQLGIIPAAG
jgi:steroid delta-isomerase-like uncharacterized protein